MPLPLGVFDVRLCPLPYQVGPAVVRSGVMDRAYRSDSLSYTNGVPVAAPALVR